MNIIETLYNRIENERLWTNHVVLKRNDYLKVSGSVDSNLYYILSGSLKITILNDGEEHIIRFGYKNNFITSLDSFITEKQPHFSLQPINQPELKVISK